MAVRRTYCLASGICWRSTKIAMSRPWNGCHVEHSGRPDGPAPRHTSRIMEPRLKSAIRVKALIRRCDLAAIGVAVTARGDPDAGAILLKLTDRDAGCTVLAQTRRPDGTAVWLRATGPAPVAETEADAYIARQPGRDQHGRASWRD